MTNSVTVTFNGVRFRRYPDSENVADRTYYKPGQGDRLKGVQALHQEVWKHHHGRPIPEGFHVHHKDHDTENNTPENLELIDGDAHRKYHANTPEHLLHARTVFQAAGAAAAPAWHASPAGRAWHSENSKKIWAERQPRDVTCENCGSTFSTRDMTLVRFCSNNCKSAARRKSGVDNVERTCAWCGRDFSVNKYAKSQCCSKSCGMKRSRQWRAQDAAP